MSAAEDYRAALDQLLEIQSGFDWIVLDDHGRQHIAENLPRDYRRVAEAFACLDDAVRALIAEGLRDLKVRVTGGATEFVRLIDDEYAEAIAAELLPKEDE